MKKKILFIALHFPPSEGVADIRATNIARELSRLNYDVTVLTANKSYYKKISKIIPKEIEGISTIRVSFILRFGSGNLIGNKYIPKIARRIILKILPYIGLDYLSFWQRNAIKEVIKKQEKFDYILATGPPFSNFILAKKLAKKLQTKYILDYRDLWTLSPHLHKEFHRKASIGKEKSVLNKAATVFFVSNSMQKAMEEIFNVKDSVVISNGFNKDSFSAIPKQKYNNFTISYVGMFYQPKRVIDPVFKALSSIKKEDRNSYKNISFIYCGRSGKYIEEKAREFDILDIIKNRGLVPREESFSVTKSSNLSLVITSVNKEANLSDKSIITGKVFEALGMDTKVLCVAPNKSDIRDVIKTQSKGIVFNGEETKKIAQFIIDEMNNYKANKHTIEGSIFEWSQLIKKMNIELNHIN